MFLLYTNLCSFIKGFLFENIFLHKEKTLVYECLSDIL
ncbi:hypothetical protein BCAH1134_C0659 (plasmid) [Bacillus cereus AH1134]|nr:hypothetical protein BCAH1134_C0659 [Bacillus cereus AH1134]